MNVLELAQVEVLGPTLAGVTGDPRWSRLRATLLTGGKSNLTFLLQSDAGSLVLRRPPTGSLLPSAHDMSRETRVQRALAGTGVPVPHVVFEDDGDLIGFPCYVMEWVEGHVIRDVLPPGYADQPADRARIGETLLRTFDQALGERESEPCALYGRLFDTESLERREQVSDRLRPQVLQ